MATDNTVVVVVVFGNYPDGFVPAINYRNPWDGSQECSDPTCLSHWAEVVEDALECAAPFRHTVEQAQWEKQNRIAHLFGNETKEEPEKPAEGEEV